MFHLRTEDNPALRRGWSRKQSSRPTYTSWQTQNEMLKSNGTRNDVLRNVAASFRITRSGTQCQTIDMARRDHRFVQHEQIVVLPMATSKQKLPSYFHICSSQGEWLPQPKTDHPRVYYIYIHLKSALPFL